MPSGASEREPITSMSACARSRVSVASKLSASSPAVSRAASSSGAANRASERMPRLELGVARGRDRHRGGSAVEQRLGRMLGRDAAGGRAVVGSEDDERRILAAGEPFEAVGGRAAHDDAPRDVGVPEPARAASQQGLGRTRTGSGRVAHVGEHQLARRRGSAARQRQRVAVVGRAVVGDDRLGGHAGRFAAPTRSPFISFGSAHVPTRRPEHVPAGAGAHARRPSPIVRP